MRIRQLFTICTFMLCLILSIVYFTPYQNHFLFIFFCLIDFYFIIKTIYIWYKQGVIAFSLFYQLILLFFLYNYLLLFIGYYVYLIIVVSFLLYLVLFKYHEKVFEGTKHSLKLKKPFIINGSYVMYIMISYFGMWLNNGKSVLDDYEMLIYNAFFPVLIIILMLFRLEHDAKTDMYMTKRENLKKTPYLVKRNIIFILFILIILFV